MSRRRLALGLVSSSLLVSAGFVGGASGDVAGLVYPRLDCKRVTQDADGPTMGYQPTGNSSQTVPNNFKPPAGADIKFVTSRVTDTTVEFFMKLAGIPAATMAQSPDDQEKAAPQESAFVYKLSFKIGDKAWYYQQGFYNDTHKQVLNAVSLASKSPDLPEAAVKTFDINRETDFVTLILDRTQVDKTLGDNAIVVGETPITFVISGDHPTKAQQKLGTTIAAEDIATADEKVAGDDYCFGPPPASLVDLAGHKGVQFGDSTKLSVALLDEEEAPLEGKEVVFTVAGKELKDETDADGVAEVTFVADVLAKSYPLEVSFAGDTAVGKVKLPDTLLVKNESTKFKPLAVAKTSATGRRVTATLIDDDNRAVGGQNVDVYVNGRKVKTLATNSSGQVVWSAAAGQTIQFRFATVGGKYNGSNSANQKLT